MVLDIQKDLLKISELEQNQKKRNATEDTLLPLFHLLPPTGWMNDPNGLCQVNGVHHIFFQYSPYEAKGGDKYWGHYETKDFLNYKYTGVFLSPDTLEDRDGVFSGCCYEEGGVLSFYYTGNVEEEGNYDYIYEGRGSNTILVTSKDGIEASKKQILLTSEDYPERLSCHVRDPKVWREEGTYYMVLGGRTKQDKGTVMLYASDDRVNWVFKQYIETTEPFGYMWECPDLFALSGKKFLSLSPQGNAQQTLCFQNKYHTGYFPCGEGLTVEAESFVEWDMGFDFYAPQTYLDEHGRRILIGWMGVPEAEYDHDPSIEKGWQHMLSVPRELVYDNSSNRIRQWPVEEFMALRGQILMSASCDEKNSALQSCKLPEAYEMEIEDICDANFELIFDENLVLSYDADQKLLSLRFLQNGYGRTVRNAVINEGLQDLRILVDSCCIEIFVNQGNYVMTTKYFYDKQLAHGRKLQLNSTCGLYKLYERKAFHITE